MPADPIGEIPVIISGDSTQLEKDLKQAEDAAREAGKKIGDALASGALGADELQSKISELVGSGLTLNQAMGQVAAGMGQAGAAFSDVGESAEGAAEKIKHIASAADEVKPAADNASHGVEGLAHQLLALGEAFALFEGLKELAEHALESFAETQKATIALGILTGSAKEAEEAIEGLREVSLSQAISFPSLVDAQVRLTNFGLSAEQIPGALRAIADAAAATNRSFDSAAGSFEKMALSGTINQRQLVNLGLSVHDLAEVLQVTDKEVKTVAKDFLDAGERSELFVQALKKIEGAGEAVAAGLSGQWQNVRSNLLFIFEDIGKALEPVASDLLRIVNDDLLPAIQSLVHAFNLLPEPVKEAVVVFGALLAVSGPLLLAVAGLGAVLEPIAAGLAVVGVATTEAALGATALSGGVIAAGIAGGLLIAKLDGVTDAALEAFNAFQTWRALGGAIDVVPEALKPLSAILHALLPDFKSISDFMPTWSDSIRLAIDAALPGFGVLREALNGIKNAFGDMSSTKLNFPGFGEAGGSEVTHATSGKGTGKTQISFPGFIPFEAPETDLADVARKALAKKAWEEARADRLKAQSIEEDEDRKHQVALLNIEMDGLKEDEKLRLISAANNLAGLQALNDQILAVTQNSINNKLAAADEEKKNIASKTATLNAQLEEAEDAHAKVQFTLQQHVTAELKKEYDKQMADLDKVINHERQQVEAVGAHVAALNIKLADDRTKAQGIAEAGEMAHDNRMLEMAKQQADADYAIGLISGKQRVELDLEYDRQEIANARASVDAQLALLEERKASERDYASKKQLLLEQLSKLEDKTTADEQKRINVLRQLNMGYADELQQLQKIITQKAMMGEAATQEIIQLEQLRRKIEELKFSSQAIGQLYVDMMKGVDRAFASTGKAIADNIVDGKNWGDVWHSLIKQIEKDFLEVLIGTAFKALEIQLLKILGLSKDVGGVLGGLGGGGGAGGSAGGGGLLGGLGGLFSKKDPGGIPGIGGMPGIDLKGLKPGTDLGGVPGVGGEPGTDLGVTPGGGGEAGGGGMGSLGGVLGIAGLGVQIATGIVNGIQNARMTNLLSGIELSTRATKEQLVGGTQTVLLTWLPKLDYLLPIWKDLDDIYNELVLLVGGTFKGDTDAGGVAFGNRVSADVADNTSEIADNTALQAVAIDDLIKISSGNIPSSGNVPLTPSARQLVTAMGTLYPLTHPDEYAAQQKADERKAARASSIAYLMSPEGIAAGNRPPETLADIYARYQRDLGIGQAEFIANIQATVTEGIKRGWIAAGTSVQDYLLGAGTKDFATGKFSTIDPNSPLVQYRKGLIDLKTYYERTMDDAQKISDMLAATPGWMAARADAANAGIPQNAVQTGSSTIAASMALKKQLDALNDQYFKTVFANPNLSNQQLSDLQAQSTAQRNAAILQSGLPGGAIREDVRMGPAPLKTYTPDQMAAMQQQAFQAQAVVDANRAQQEATRNADLATAQDNARKNAQSVLMQLSKSLHVLTEEQLDILSTNPELGQWGTIHQLVQDALIAKFKNQAQAVELLAHLMPNVDTPRGFSSSPTSTVPNLNFSNIVPGTGPLNLSNISFGSGTTPPWPGSGPVAMVQVNALDPTSRGVANAITSSLWAMGVKTK